MLFYLLNSLCPMVARVAIQFPLAVRRICVERSQWRLMKGSPYFCLYIFVCNTSLLLSDFLVPVKIFSSISVEAKVVTCVLSIL